MYVYIWTHLAYVCIYVWIFKLYNQFSKYCIWHRVSKYLNLYHSLLCNHMVSRDVTMRPQWICWSWWKSSHCYSWEFCNLYFDYFFLIINFFSYKIIYIDIIYNYFLEIILLIWCWVSLCAHFYYFLGRIPFHHDFHRDNCDYYCDLYDHIFDYRFCHSVTNQFWFCKCATPWIFPPLDILLDLNIGLNMLPSGSFMSFQGSSMIWNWLFLRCGAVD